MKKRPPTLLRWVSTILLAAAPTLDPAAAAPGDRARIQGLSDIAFGTIANTVLDSRASQSICVYSNSATGGYAVTANGSGAGGAFLLASGSASLAFEVEWAQAPGQANGTALVANGVLSGLVSTANNQNCAPSGTSASLIVVIRALAASAAMAGAYAGTLTLIVEPT